MLAVGHTGAGIIIGEIVSRSVESSLASPVAGFLLAYGLHYLEDAIPHGHIVEYEDLGKNKSYPLIFADLSGSALLFFAGPFLKYGLSSQLFVISASIIGSLLPDVIASMFYYPGRPPVRSGLIKLERLVHESTHWHGLKKRTLKLGWYDAWQIVVIAAALFLRF